MLERTSGVPQGEGRRPEDRVGGIGATDRPMPMYTPGQEAVTYGRGTLRIVVGIPAALFALFFGWVLFLR